MVGRRPLYPPPRPTTPPPARPPYASALRSVGCTPLFSCSPTCYLCRSFGGFLVVQISMGQRTRKKVLSTMRKRVLLFTVILAALDVGLDKGDLLPLGGQLGKACLHLCWGLSWHTLHHTHARRYLRRDRSGLAKTDAWFRRVFFSASEERFRQHFRFSRSTFENAQRPAPDTSSPCSFPPTRGGSTEDGITTRHHFVSLGALRKRVFRGLRRGPVRGLGGGGHQEHAAGGQGACGRSPAAFPVAKCATARRALRVC